MKINGAKAVAHILKTIGVNNIWGIPGVRTLSFYNEIYNIGINTALVANELSTSFINVSEIKSKIFW